VNTFPTYVITHVVLQEFPAQLQEFPAPLQEINLRSGRVINPNSPIITEEEVEENPSDQNKKQLNTQSIHRKNIKNQNLHPFLRDY
jgi:hypothetical protein